MDRVFERFIDRLGCTEREFLEQALDFVNQQDPVFYRQYRWPRRTDDEHVLQQSELDVMVPLAQRSDEITTALVELETAPRHLVAGQVVNIRPQWDDPTDLSIYALNCLTMYTEQKAANRIYKEFLTCMIAMSYSCTMDALYQTSLANERQSVEARRLYFDLRKEVKKSTHDRLMRIGRRSLELVEVFRSLSAFAILGPYKLSVIDRMGAASFDAFLTLLQGELARKEPISVNITRVQVDNRLIYVNGLHFPPQLQPYLPEPLAVSLTRVDARYGTSASDPCNAEHRESVRTRVRMR